VRITAFACGPLGCNCSIVADEIAKIAIVVDPGGDFDRIRAEVESDGYRVQAIVHTHTHIDHVGATAPLQRWSGAGAYIHEEDRFLYDMLGVQAELLGLPEVPERCDLSGALVDGHTIAFGALTMDVLHTPGHTPGSCSFHVSAPEGRIVFTGDTLFRRGIGRTDLWGGDSALIEKSLKERLLALDDDTMVVPGHGGETTIGDERRGNPFLRR
jgi:hydroxyacylglutathione hydrolase